MRFRTFIPLVATVVASSASAQAYSTSTFTGWGSPITLYASPGSSGGGNAGASSAPGNVDSPVWRFHHNLNGELLLGHFSPFTWNPSTQGAISSVAMGYLYQNTSFNRPNSAIAMTPVVAQGGTYFAYAARWSYLGGGYDAPFQSDGRRSFNGTLVADPAEWCSGATGATFFVCGVNAPDFSASGGLIEFGMFSGNSGSSGPVTGEFDNFYVELDTDAVAVPEPASILLMATGLISTRQSCSQARLSSKRRL